MKLSLVVMTAGKQQGKVLDIGKLSQFLVGRDPQCHLRPASPLISKRHCAIIQRDGKAFVRDFTSTNGTFVNDEPVSEECELHDNDQLKIGPLLFTVRIEASTPVSRPTPAPATKPVTKAIAPAATKIPVPPAATPPPATTGGSEDEDIAAMLLSLQDDGGSGGSSSADEVPEGSTVMDLKLPTEGGQTPKEAPKPKPAGNTQDAAKNILEKYMRRPRA